MAARSLTERVEILEKKVEALEHLPGRVDALAHDVGTFRAEFLQFRDETQVALSAIHGRMDGIEGTAKNHDDDERRVRPRTPLRSNATPRPIRNMSTSPKPPTKPKNMAATSATIAITPISQGTI